MAITFPRDWLDELELVGLTFSLAPAMELTPLRSGSIIAKDLGPTLWRARYESDQLDVATLGRLRAWYSTLTSTQAFYGYDLLREYPLLYPGGSGLFSGFGGTGSLDDVTQDKLVDISGLPAGLVLSEGDYIAFDYGANDSRALHMAVNSKEANGSGVISNLEVRPHVRTGWVAAATVHLHKPAAKMFVLPGTYQEAVSGNGYGRISFEAIQTL